MTSSRILLVSAISLLCVGCSGPETSPDQTLAGAALGAAWGAGAGAVVGHQVSYAGEGAAVGAGFGLVAGAMAGAGHDVAESHHAKLEKDLASLRIQNLSNGNQLQALQQTLDRAITADYAGGVHQVFFDDDATSLRAGAIANLETIADSLRKSAHAHAIKVVGHSDDAGAPEYNDRLAEARARNVSSYLMARGISADQITVESHGSKRPIASNATEVGRQLNRRVDVFIMR